MTTDQLKLIDCGDPSESPGERLAKFNEFWKWYPVKKGKPKARAIFLAITSDGGYDTKSFDKDSGTYIPLHLSATSEEIIEAAKEFWKSLPKKGNSYTPDTTYCPHPATWLNQGRFEDG